MTSHGHRSRGRCRVLPLILLCVASAQWAAQWTFVPPARLVKGSPEAASPSAQAAHAAPAAAEQGGLFSALAAYGHYLGLVLGTGCLVAERLMIKAGMSEEEEQTVLSIDSLYGLVGLLIAGTGYLRVTQYGKGWEFYQHEPIFWLKLTLAAILGAASFFVTATFIKRGLARDEAKKTGSKSLAPVTEKLADRLTSVINAQLLAIGSIPLAATLMARGVLYVDWFPWQAGALPVVLMLGGLGFKYVKEAIDWSEDE
ncbi:unnamed protein product [Symbiodinium natans]|uniref:Uncharacterized protein n=1 Tax=Symbiodinium natans TaxID=878477 RepID=A0A812KUP2_9DINO|nr:unnamed protein product [Symbiodinium natans]